MEIRPEDLFKKCSACAGTGKVATKNGGDPIYVTEGAVPTACEKCDGKGIMLTDSGTVLRAFFQMMQDGKF
jgi:DnaJ-class molecular chaperone